MATAQGAPSRGGTLLRIKLPEGRAANLIVYVIRRLLWMIPVLFFVILITFTLMHFTPGSPWDANTKLKPDAIRLLNEKYGLNEPAPVQFGKYLLAIIHFDFGTSLIGQGQTVSGMIALGWPYTFTIGALAFAVVTVFGVGLGVLAALRQNSMVDYVALTLATIGASTPNFVVGIVLIVVFSLGLYHLTQGNFLLPAGGFGFDDRLIMPVVTLAFLPMAFIARLTRASTLETLRQDFVRTAWAKGLAGRKVVMGHVLRNSLIPVVTALGPTFAFLITGSFVVERIFQIPGIGRLFVTSIQGRDYPVILGTTILFAVIIALANLVVDVLYVFIDPRVRLID